MKQFILLVVLLFTSGLAFASLGKTRGGDVACFKKEDVAMVLRLAQSGAQESAMSYFQTDKCLTLRENKRVVVIGTPDAMVQFHYRRFVLWSIREAIIYDK